MSIIKGDIICENCGKKIDKQLLENLLISEITIKEKAIEANEKLNDLLEGLKKITSENKKLNDMCAALKSLELLIDELGDIKLSRLVKVCDIIRNNLPNPLFLDRDGEDIHYERNYSIKNGKKKQGEVKIKYDGDILTAYVSLEKIGNNSFVINEERVIEVLHFIESINCKKDS